MGNIMEYDTGWNKGKPLSWWKNLKAPAICIALIHQGSMFGYVQSLCCCVIYEIFFDWKKMTWFHFRMHVTATRYVYDNDATAWCCFVKRYVSVCLDIDLSRMNPPLTWAEGHVLKYEELCRGICCVMRRYEKWIDKFVYCSDVAFSRKNDILSKY